jgi:hypothetical protein
VSIKKLFKSVQNSKGMTAQVRIFPELLTNLERDLLHYRRFGDTNPLHYFDISPNGQLGTLLGTSEIRIVPGAVLAVAIYDHLTRNAVQEGHAPSSLAFTFPTPTLFSNGNGAYHLFEQDIGKPHRIVEVTEMKILETTDDISWIMYDLYSCVGQLWKEKGLATLASAEVPMVAAISIADDLPDNLIPKGTSPISYGRGQIAIRTLPYRVFERMLGPYLAVKPA